MIKIGIINTGGTISCVGNPLSPMTAEEFSKSCKKYFSPIAKAKFADISLYYVEDLYFPESKSKTLDSTNLQPTDWCLIAKYILDNYHKYDSWIILHGTDTMDFTGAALPLLLSDFDAEGKAKAVLNKTIVITGSQLPMFYKNDNSKNKKSLDITINFNTDAFQNFCGAILVASTGIPETCIYFNNKILRSSRVLKASTDKFDAFNSYNYPKLGKCGINIKLYNNNISYGPITKEVSLSNSAVLNKLKDKLIYIKNNINNFPVIQLNAFPGSYGIKNNESVLARLIDNCCNNVTKQKIKGIVLESYGAGNLPSANPDNPKQGDIYIALDNAIKNGTIVINCSQVTSGIVNDGIYASGSWLQKIGVIDGVDMTSIAAYTKLMIIMTIAEYKNWSTKTIKYLLQSNIAGEIMNINSLDSEYNNVLLPGESIKTLDGSATLLNNRNSGIILYANNTKSILWKPKIVGKNKLTGNLKIKNDGLLVYYNYNDEILWSSSNSINNSSVIKLILAGSYHDKTLKLLIYDCKKDKVESVLYSINET